MSLWDALRLFSRGPGNHRRLRRDGRRTRKVTKPRDLHFERFEDRVLLSINPQLLAIIPNEGDTLAQGKVLHTAPQELTFRFNDGQQIDPASLGGIQMVRAGGDGLFGNGNDVNVDFGYIGVLPQPSQNEVVARFKETLPDDTYRITITSALTNISGQPFDNSRIDPHLPLDFKLDLGAQVTAVVPQPVTRGAGGALQQADSEIDVYFSSDALNPASAQNPDFYQLIATNDTADPADDVVTAPSSVTYVAAENKAVLLFPADINSLLPSGKHSFRLRIGELYQSFDTTTLSSDDVTSDAGDTYATARPLDNLGSAATPQSLVVGGQIETRPYDLQWPGSDHDPGHRLLPIQPDVGVGPYLTYADSHYVAPSSSDVRGVTTYYYNFEDFYGYDIQGNALHNAITATQEQRGREIFELYSKYSGVQFVESDSQGFTIATGDLAAAGGISGTGGDAFAVSFGTETAVMDGNVDWGNSEFGGRWFTTAMQGIGMLLGLGHTSDLPSATIMGNDPSLGSGEGIFPGLNDLVHARNLYRPDSTDIDLYKFTVAAPGTFSAETIAQRLDHASLATSESSSLLNSELTLFEQYLEGGVTKYRAIARNDDYFGKDSYLQWDLQPGTYYIGVTASGNDKYDPLIPDSGIGGTTQGPYDLRVNFTPKSTNNSNHLVDATNTWLDGDADGTPGGVYDFWFNAPGATNRTIFVDKLASSGGSGTLTSPYNTIPAALAAAVPGDMVRIVGNNFANDDAANPTTLTDNQPYEIGTDIFGNPLADGLKMELPRGVTVMIDAGAVLKLRGANIDLGSSAIGIDRSGAALQVLGTPAHSVYFTSYFDEGVGKDNNPLMTTPSPGDWGGLVFHSDLDHAYNNAAGPGTQKRADAEKEGIFVNYVNHADLRYGGGGVVVNSVRSVYDPIYMAETRVTASFNTITHSADAAMSADPNSFLESKFEGNESPSVYTAEYDRVGPELHGNRLLSNSINAVMVRIRTDAGKPLDKLTVSARFSDRDIVYVIPENLVIAGAPGGPTQINGTSPLEDGNFNRIIVPDQLPPSPANPLPGYPYADGQYFDLSDGGTPVRFEFDLLNNGVAPGNVRILWTNPILGGAQIAQTIADAINSAAGLGITATATGNTITLDGPNVITEGLYGQQSRLPARLAIDPGIVVKLGGSRIETQMGGELLAEGTAQRHVVFTSLEDDRYGAAGTFDTTGDGFTAPPSAAANAPKPGDWGGLYFAPTSLGSIDHALIAYGGGRTTIEGGSALFNAIEIHQGQVRLTNSELSNNASGGDGDRNGRGWTTPGAIFVRGAQPVIVNNTIRDNSRNGDGTMNTAPAVNIDLNSLTSDVVPDWGRSTGLLDSFVPYGDNHGPLVRLNKLSNDGLNGMLVRGGALSTQSIWDDADVVHVVQDEIIASNQHTFGGLRLESSDQESLVVKLAGASAGLTAMGKPLEITDRIGGTVQVVGMPGHPVVLTALADDTVGAGFDPAGQPQNDTDNIANSAAQPGAWRSIKLDKYSNDRNVAVVNEAERAYGSDPVNSNDTAATAQSLGQLAAANKGGDDNLRLGFEVHGAIRLDNPGDVDLYRFQATAGSEVWLDINLTTFALDTVIELVDANGVMVARSDNSVQEAENPSLLGRASSATINPTWINPLQRDPWHGEDFYTYNPRDAGMRVVLPGPTGQVRPYYVKVYSKGPVTPGQERTRGEYQLQVRLQETEEIPGSTVQYADIRYATNGIEILGMPTHSPLLADTIEVAGSNTFATAQDIGNLLGSDRGAITVAGHLANVSDVNWYRFRVSYQDIHDPLGTLSALPTIFDVNYADGLGRPDVVLWIFDSTGRLIYMADGSNVVDNRPDPTKGANLDDLSRGSPGPNDPYLGPVQLNEGPNQTYYVAVTGRGLTANALQEDLLRREPIDALRRIAEDHVGNGDGNTLGLTPLARSVDGSLIPDQTTQSLSLQPAPFNLGDVLLYVSTDDDLFTVNPFTGAYENDVSATGGNYRPTSHSSPNLTYGDVAMRADGELYTETRSGSVAASANADAGQYERIDTGDAKVNTTTQWDGISIYQVQNGALTVQNVGGGGVSIEAMAHSPNVNAGFVYVVGNRPSGAGLGPSAADPNQGPVLRNLLFKLDANGVAIDYPNPPTNTSNNTPKQASGTDVVPLASLLTSPTIFVPPPTDTIPPLNNPGDILDGLTFTATDNANNPYTFEFDSGLDVQMTPTGLRGIRDGNTFTLATSPSNTTTFEFDSGPVLVVDTRTPVTEFESIAINTPGNNPTFYVFVRPGDIIPPRPGQTIVPITYLGSETNGQLTNLIVNAINNNPPANVGNPAPGVQVAGFVDPVSGFGRISMSGEQQVVLSGGMTGVSFGGTDYGVAPGNVRIPFEEEGLNNSNINAFTAGANSIGTAVRGAMSNVTASYAHRLASPPGDRLTFINDTLGGTITGDFSGVPSFSLRNGLPINPVTPSHEGTNYPGQNNILVQFHAGDTGAALAAAMATAINTVPSLRTANAIGSRVEVRNASLLQLSPPLTGGGGGPGGDVTGMAFMNVAGRDRLFAVSDGGGLYEVRNITSASASSNSEWTFVPTPAADPIFESFAPGVGRGQGFGFGAYLEYITTIQGKPTFQGLSAGPLNVEGSKYRNLLFGVTDMGQLYAFNTQGALQPVFLNGQTNMQLLGSAGTAVGTFAYPVSGVTFSNIDYNLWHETTRRGGTPAADRGHGINPTEDYSRPGQQYQFPASGGGSMYFGLEDPRGGSIPATRPNGQPNTQPGSTLYQYRNTAAYQTYDMPGGAHGSLVSNPFSLVGYAAVDRPAVYFNYFMEGGGPTSSNGATYFDEARVFASADDANWSLLKELTGTSGTSWQQQMLDLSAFAGQGNVRLRFDFTTSGDMHVGDDYIPGNVNYDGGMLTGAYMSAIPGNQLRDADFIDLENDVNYASTLFEFDLGGVLDVPDGAAGARIPDGQQFTIVDGSNVSTTFEFDVLGNGVAGTNVPIALAATDSPLDVVAKIISAISANGLNVTTKSFEGRVEILGATSVSVTPGSGLTGVVLEGDGPGVSSGMVTIPVDFGMTALQVANRMVSVFDATYAGGVSGTSLKLDATIPMFHMVGYRAIYSGPLPYSIDLPGDHPLPLPWPATPGIADRYHNIRSGQDNAHEGVYIDDIIVGFADRGEMVTGANANDTGFSQTRLANNFVQNTVWPVPRWTGDNGHDAALTPDEYRTLIPAGDYQLQIRRAPSYGSVYYPAVHGPANYRFSTLSRSFDTNDRMTNGITLQAPPAGTVYSGQTFTVYDGLNTKTFEYVLQGRAPTGGRVAVNFKGTEDAAGMAALIVQAINGAAAGGFGVTAATNSTTGRVDLFGASWANDGPTSDFIANRSSLQDITLVAPAASDIQPSTSTFTIYDGFSSPLTFEYVLSWAAPSGFNVPIRYTGSESAAEMAGLMAQAINLAVQERGFGVSAATLGDTGRVQLSRLSSVTTTPGVADTIWVRQIETGVSAMTLLAPRASTLNIRTPQTFSIYDGFLTRTFEYVLTGSPPTPGNVSIDYSGTETEAQMAWLIANAINTSGLNVGATADGVNSRVNLFNAISVKGIGAILVFNEDVAGKLPGDSTSVRDQGQIIIESNKITYSQNWGISVGPGSRESGSNLPHPAAAATLSQPNSERLVGGITIENNAVAFGGAGGIRFSGDTNPAGQPVAAVPFGRIVNNTVYGSAGVAPSGTGIAVQQNASPTLLNNIVAKLATGVSVDATSASTVVGSTAYQNNAVDTTGVAVESFPLRLTPADPLFVNAAAGDFYLAKYSPAIDSSIDSLQDRAAMVTVESPLGIPPSPILAPDADMWGQLRSDDPLVAPPAGMGRNIFKDRGAIDRVDFMGPTAQLVQPLDNDPAGLDQNPLPNDVSVPGQVLAEFAIQLLDPNGTGIDNSSVTKALVAVYRDNALLSEGLDYAYRYDATNHIIHLSAGPGVWANGHNYKVVLDNGLSGIRDVAGNLLLPNRPTGTTEFNLQLSGSNPALNTAPVIDTNAIPVLSIVPKNSTSPQGDLIGPKVDSTITDPDPGALKGIAVTATTGTVNGTWQYSLNGGTSWPPFPALADTVAVLLRDSDMLRFVPNPGFVGFATITYHAWDQTQGIAGQTADVSSGKTGGRTAYSVGTQTASVEVAVVPNRAPVLDNSVKFSLTPVTAGDPNNPGTLVTTLLASAGGNRISDPDPGPLQGIAIIGASSANGGWQFSVDGGAAWFDLGTPSVASARLLAADAATLIRFTPNPGFTGAVDPGVTFRAWDQTSGTNGATADTTQNGDPSAFSLATATATVSVNPPPPVFKGDGIGVFKSGYWALDRNRDLKWGAGDGGALVFGWDGATPVTGDWNGDGKTEIGCFANGAWWLDTNANGAWDGGDAFFYYGWQGATPIVGDWNGDGTDDIGVYNLGVWFRDLNGNRVWDGPDQTSLVYFGWDGAVPVPGKWKGDKADQVGVYANGAWVLDVNGSNQWDSVNQSAVVYYGWNGAAPVVGDWNADGKDEVAVYASATWYRDVNGNGQWDSPDKAAMTSFGTNGNGRPVVGSGTGMPLPVVGNWADSGGPLLAAGPAVSTSQNLPVLTDAQLKPIVHEAIARWAAAGLGPQALDALSRVEFAIADLPGSYLGKAAANRITLDRDAAGRGWFVDPTPQQDEEFISSGAHGQQRAIDPKAVDRIDLLTVVEHELGHIAGLSDLEASMNDLMNERLGTGVRRTPQQADVDAIFAFGKTW